MINSRSLVEVGVAMVLKDRFSNEAGRISNSFRTMMNDMNTWNRGIQMSAANAFDFGKELVGGMAKAYQYSAGVYDQVFLASKMSGANAAQQARLMQVAKEVNEVTPLTAKDIASGERYLAMAGNNVEQIEKMIGPAAKLASIFSMPLGEKGGVADLMTNIIQTFNIPSQNATQVVDQLATAVTSANISLTDLAQSFQYSGAEFRNAKISMGDAAAAIGILGNQGIQASSAGTALANMMRYLTLSVTGQKKAGSTMLKSLGIDPASLVDSQGNLLRLDKIITMLGDKLRGRRGIDISSALFNIFGVRGTRAASALLQDYWSGTNKLTELMDKVNSAKGTVEGLTQERLQTPAGIIEQFKSNWENFVVTAGATLAQVFSPILKLGSGLLKIINDIQETWAGRFLVKVVAVKTLVSFISAGFRTASSWVKMLANSASIVSANAQSQRAAVTQTNAGYASMESHLIYIGQLLKYNAMMAMRAQGLTYNKAGQLINKKTGRYAWMPFFPMMGPGPSGGSGRGSTGGKGLIGGGSMLAGGTSTFARWAIKGGLSKGVTRTLGSIISVAGKFGGPWGWALSFGLPILIDVIGGLTSSVDKNTDALNSDDNKASIQERNQQAFIDAVRVAIRDGFKDTRIGVSIDGQPVGDFAPGSSSDFTGIALGIN